MNIYNDRVFYLIGGPNGSGKTTLARELIKDKPDVVFLNSDDVASAQGISAFNAGIVVMKQSYDIVNNHTSFALETTLSGHFHNRLINLAHEHEYKVVFVYVFLPSVEQNIARVRQRVALGGHNVPEEDIRRRYEQSIKNVGNVCCKADQWEVYNNGGKKYKLVARGIKESATDAENAEVLPLLKHDARYMSKYLLELANRGAFNARQAALEAGVPIVYQGR